MDYSDYLNLTGGIMVFFAGLLILFGGCVFIYCSFIMGSKLFETSDGRPYPETEGGRAIMIIVGILLIVASVFVIPLGMTMVDGCCSDDTIEEAPR